MAIFVSKRKAEPSKVAEPKGLRFFDTFLFKILSRVPVAVLLLIFVFVWTSSTSIISGNIVHVCISSRKLNNPYCLSAGVRPNFEIPVPIKNIDADSSINVSISQYATPSKNGTVKETVNLVMPAAETKIEELDKDGSTSSSGNNKDIENVGRLKPNGIVMDGTAEESYDEEIANAKKEVEEQMRLHRSWKSNLNNAGCDGREIYVYDLPSKFNKDLIGQCRDMIPWTDMCGHFDNEALGEPMAKLGKSWYSTHQYSLEPIFHARILKHPCRVYNEDKARLFYVPYYGGLDILRWHFKNVSNDVKDALSLELIKWLEPKKSWVQNSGKDHVFVLGKVSWDFRRKIDYSWGSKFLSLEQMKNPIKLLIERQPWEVNEIGIPHPTYFHPHSDEDIAAWQSRIIRAPRKSLVSFAGAERPGQSESIRSILIDQCTSTTIEKCKFLNCSSGRCDQPEPVVELFIESQFCLQPPGDSPTRKSIFDSLVAGCIPVLFDPFTAYYQYPWHLPEDHGKYSVFIDQEQVRQMKVNVVERLMNVSVKDIDDMRRYIVYELLPGLVYGDSSSQFVKFQDAFSITVNNLLEMVNRL